MNVSRFQIALNHEDPNVIISGLKSFRHQILKEHEALYAFGYNGRAINSLIFSSSSNILHPHYSKYNEMPIGLLLSYLQSSPQIEELFVLWNLPGYDINKDLCSSHMSCLASMLFCAHKDETFCNYVINRVISEYCKSILAQLSSGNQNVVHSTLGLCIAMARISRQHACDTYQKIMISNNLFATLLQRGKSVIWPTDDVEVHIESISTDSRLLIIIWFLLIMDAADSTIAAEIATSNSILRRITNGIHKDPTYTIIITLNGIKLVRSNSTTLIQTKIVDNTFQERILELYGHEDDDVQHSVNIFLTDHCKYIISNLKSFKRNDPDIDNNNSSGNSFYAASQLIRNLQAHTDLRHRNVQMIILNAQPSMLSICISSINMSRDPQPTIDYLSSISHLIYLIQNVGIDKNLKSLVKNAAINGCSEVELKTAIYKLIHSVVPNDFQKNSFSKILLHQNAMVQRMGLVLVKSVAQRISRIIPAKNVTKDPKFEAALAVCLEEHLPDMQVFINIWNKYFKVDDLESQKSDYLLCLGLKAMEAIVNIFPSSISDATFDLLRILDDVVPWNIKENAEQCASAVNLRNIDIAINLVNLLRTATLHKRCKWFGTKDDVIKALTNVIVIEDWSNSIKRDPLAKLIILAKCSNHQLKLDASNLFRIVLNQTDIFENDPALDYEMMTEANIWLSTQSTANSSILLSSIILRIAYHWSANYMIAADELRGKVADAAYLSSLISAPPNKCNINATPFSAALYCGISLCSTNFSVLMDYLPKHIKSHLFNNDEVFIQKFVTGFQQALHSHMLQILTLSTIRARNRMSYSNEILIAIKYFNISGRDSMITDIEDLRILSSLHENSNETSSDARIILSRIGGKKNVSISESDSISSKKRRLTKNSDIGVEATQHSISIGQGPNAICAIVLRFDELVNDNYKIEESRMEIWLFVISLYLSTVDTISMNFLLWIKSCFDSSILYLNDKEIRIDQQASFISQSLEILIKMVKLIHGSDNSALIKTHKRTRNSDVNNISKLQLISEICSTLESFAVNLIFATSCSQIILTLLDSELVIYEFKQNSSAVGSLVRKILCAASNAQYRKFNIEKKAFTVHSLWKNLAKLFDSQFNFHEKDLSLFSLGWALQSFLDDGNLKSFFINKIFDGPEGFSALELTVQNAVKQNTDRDRGLIVSALFSMNAISSSIIMSAQKSAISKSMLEYMLQPSMKLVGTKLSNSMVGITIGINSISGSILPEFDFYYDNLLFFDPKVSNASANILFNVNHKFSAIVALSAFERMKSDNERKNSTVFQSIIRNVCPNLMTNSMVTAEGINEILEQRISISENLSTSVKNILIDLLQAIDVEEGALIQLLVELLKEEYLSNETFVTNFAIVLLKSSDQLNTFLSTASIAVSFLMCALSVLKKEQKKVTTFIRKFGTVFCEIVMNICDESSTVVSYLQSSDIDSESYCNQYLPGILQVINLLIFADVLSTENCWANDENFKILSHLLQSNKISVQKKLNKFMKTSLKWGISKEYIIDSISSLIGGMHKLNENMLIWSNLFSPDVNDFYHPQMLFQMIVSHSKFLAVLCESETNISIIRLLLHLTIYASSNEWVEDASLDEFLVKSLLNIYTGKMKETDRLILRILHIMHRAQRCGELCTLELSGSLRKSLVSDLKYSLSARSWITSVLSQATVYSTLSNFPFWRSLLPQPFVMESRTGSKRYNDEMIQLINTILPEWENHENPDVKDETLNECIGNDDVDNNFSDESNTKEGSDDDDDDDDNVELQSDDSESLMKATSDQDYSDSEPLETETRPNYKNLRQLLSSYEHEETLFFDHLSDCSDKLYDPSYWLPVLHYSLQQYDLSMRQLSNSGAISLVIASLGSCCPLLRTIALSCLQHILKYLRRQDRTKDVAFRERPQLLLLINFIRNSLSYHDKGLSTESDGRICPRLPPTIAITLGRAAMHLLQPSNDLFGAINKYLLSRPYCDFKDLPMWEMLVMNADIISEQSKRLTELRLIRDGINSKQDHLNLCRKNGYSKLMLMFPLLMKDHKISHAILDILDKVMSLQHSARYLIQRCDIIFWLQQLILPFKSLDITSQTSIVNESNDDDCNEAKRFSKTLAAIPIYILPRLLSLLRRSIGACFFLTNSNEISSSIYFDINTVILSTLDSISLIDRNGYSHVLTPDFFHNFVLCLWELLLTSSVQDSVCNSQMSWGLKKLVDLSMAIANDEKKNSMSKDVKNDFLTSVLGLLSFKQFKNTTNSDSTSDAIKLMMAAMVDRVGIQANTDISHYNLLKFSKGIVHDNSHRHVNNFMTSVNIFFEDHTMLPSNSNTEFNSFVDFNYNMQRSWHEFSRLKYEDMELPTHTIDSKSTLMLITKGMLNILSSLVNGGVETTDLIKVLDETIPSSLIRWTLIMSNLFLNSNNHFGSVPSDSFCIEKLKIRIFSTVDNGINVSQYTKSFSEFQLLIRLTLLCIISLEYNCHYSLGQEFVTLRLSIIKVLKTLTQAKIDFNDSRETTMLLLQHINDGIELWNSSTNTRSIITELCLLTLDLAGAYISYMDKYKSSINNNTDDFSEYLNNIGPKRLDTLCNLFHMNYSNDLAMDYDIFQASKDDENDLSLKRLSETKFNSRFFHDNNNNPNKKFRKNIDA